MTREYKTVHPSIFFYATRCSIVPQSLFYAHPNYNPMNMAEMKQFGDSLIAAEIDEPYLHH